MDRLQGLAAEVLALPNLTAHQRLVWATSLRLNAVPAQELPPWFWERRNITRRPPGVDLLSLDGRRAIRCCAEDVGFAPVRRFLRLAKWVYKALDCMLVTSSPDVLPKQSKTWLRRSKAKRQTLPSTAPRRSTRCGSRLSRKASQVGQADSSDPPLRLCQRDCLEACAKGARVIEMACGTGKTRVMKELAQNISGRVLITVPLLALLEQFALDFPSFCKVGMGYNKDIDYNAKGFLAVSDSVELLQHLKFDAILVDEAHRSLPAGFPTTGSLYRFSATHKDEPDFRYSMGQAMEDGVLCDYDLTVPIVTPQHGHTYLSLADLLLKQAGRFRRVLAYCNSVRESKNFRMVLRKLGLAAWHMNGRTRPKKRQDILDQFSGTLQRPVHVLVTVEVLGEGINIPNADTCMFVEPRGSYRSIVQAIGRVLRPHPCKPLAHIVLPAVALTPQKPKSYVLPALSSEREATIAVAKATPIYSAVLPDCKQSVEARNKQDPTLPHVDADFATPRDVPGRGSTHHPQEQKTQEQPASSMHAWHNHSKALPGGSEDGAAQQRTSNGSLLFANSSLRSSGLTESSPGKLQEMPALEAHTVLCAATCANLELHSANVVSHCAISCPQALPGESRAEKQTESNSHIVVRVATKASSDVARIAATAVAPTTHFSTADGCQEEPVHGGDMEEAFTKRGRRLAVRWHATHGAHSFSSQLQRFFAALIHADHRFGQGQALGQRVEVVDCTAAWRKRLDIDQATRRVFAELAEVLRKKDPWEARFRDLECFVLKHVRLPRQQASCCEEASLCHWVQNQGSTIRQNQLLAHRLHRLLNSTSALVRKRVQGWLDMDQQFVKRCEALREYIMANGSLPRFSDGRRNAGYRLVRWLLRQARRTDLPKSRRKLLESIHPLVRAKLNSLTSPPLRVKAELWQQQWSELLKLVSREGRLPLKLRENGLYQWLTLQRRRFRSGRLPKELLFQLQGSHWLIVEFCEKKTTRGKVL